MINAMTVDVEDYFQVSAFEKHIPRESWDKQPSRVERNTDKILDIFDEYDVKATFFVLGWVAERCPGLISRIVESGHELASHGYSHARVTTLSPTDFQEDITRTKKILEDLGGVQVKGYRAPTYSIGRANLWAFDILKDAGYLYSSSIYPIRHDLYGMPEAPRFAFQYRSCNGIVEIPVTTVECFKQKLPCGGGGYFRLLPYMFSKYAIGRVNRSDREEAVFYFHPWEIDPGQPRQKGISRKTKFRHYLNLNLMEARLRRLVKDFKWGRMDEIFLNNREKNNIPVWSPDMVDERTYAN